MASFLKTLLGGAPGLKFLYMVIDGEHLECKSLCHSLLFWHHMFMLRCKQQLVIDKLHYSDGNCSCKNKGSFVLIVK